MKKAKLLLFAAAVLLGATASANALARGFHHHAHVGVFIGAPVVFSPWYYHPYPYYYPAPAYYPAPVVYPAAPTTYVEQGQPDSSSAPRADNYWYYCPGAKAYYPYVKECAGGWQRVSPQPPPS